jgi:hypothetical protein
MGFWVNTLIGVPLTAYVDESYCRRRGESTCVYTLVGVVVDDTDLDVVRSALCDLRSGKDKTLHWRREQPERLPVIAEAVRALPMSAVVTVVMHNASVDSERARRHCLSQLLRELFDAGSEQVVFESRQAEDRKDLQVIAGWRRAKRPEAMVRVDFLPAVAEPALWLADIVAGAFMWWLGGACDHWSVLADACRVVEVSLP